MTELEFKRDLAALLNKHGVDAAVKVPDFILAEYIGRHLAAMRELNQAVEQWHAPDNNRRQNAD